MKRIAIIGGGITGLTIAYLLEQQKRIQPEKLDYLLIEKADHFGGMLFTEKIRGFTIEGGSDSYVSFKPEANWLIKALGLETETISPNMANRGSYVLSGHKIYPLPDGVALLLPFKIMDFAKNPLISWPGKLRAACDLFIPAKSNHGDESLASFINRRLGNEMLEKVIGPLVGGIHSIDPQIMSLEATFPRFLQMEREDRSLILALQKMKRRGKKRRQEAAEKGAPPTRKRRSPVLSFKQGMGTLSTAIEKELSPTSLYRQAEVISIQPHHDGGYRLTFQNGEEEVADEVVLALGANHASTLVHGWAPELSSLFAEIPFTSSASISFGYWSEDLPTLPSGFGITIPAREKRKITALNFTSRKWEGRVPDEEHCLVRILAGGYANPELVKLDDHQFLKVIKRELQEMLGITAEPVVQRIYRWSESRPQYSLGHLERVHQIETQLEQHQGLHIAGSSYYGAGVSDCIASGIKTAQQLLHTLGLEGGGPTTGKPF